jgi:basic membrane protein A and related proteins
MLSKKVWFTVLSLIVLFAFLMVACQPAAPAAEEPAAEEPAAEAPAEEEMAAEEPAEEEMAEEEMAEEPAEEEMAEEAMEITSVKVAIFHTGPRDEPWAQAIIQAFERVMEDPPHGLVIEYVDFEKVPIDDYEKFIRDVVETGEYDIHWIHDASAGTDPVDTLIGEYPELIFPVTASNYYPVGGNGYWIQNYAHEPAYLCGIIAGQMTETNQIGMVAGFPYASVNHLLNAFVAGAQSVNPDVEFKNSYIESWWDPVKAKETALAQIEAGADIIFSERYGGFEAARDKGMLAFAAQADVHDLAPETIITAPLMYWDPSIANMIEVWYDHEMNGTAYAASADEPVFFLMKDGGSALAPLYNFEDSLPADVLASYEDVKAQIMDGSFTVELNKGPVELE